MVGNARLHPATVPARRDTTETRVLGASEASHHRGDRRAWTARLLVSSAIALVMAMGVEPATGQTGDCPSSTLGAATVTIERVSPEPPVAGQDVLVHGRARSTLPVSRAELWVDDVRVDSRTFAQPGTSVPFTLRWPSTAVRPGPARLRTVVCGNGAVAGVLVSGASSRNMNVAQAQATAPA
ncbi:MAG TPA: hypothetical protein VG455_09385, partial [Acidimicrobiales bacterium]|nr:hypothetical protein [Acidimicrobiales bacterium]